MWILVTLFRAYRRKLECYVQIDLHCKDNVYWYRKFGNLNPQPESHQKQIVMKSSIIFTYIYHISLCVEDKFINAYKATVLPSCIKLYTEAYGLFSLVLRYNIIP